jgi:phosphohistidine phosphatase
MLYIIRHADAVSGPVDAKRRLSTYGHSQVKALGNYLKQTEIAAPEEVWHSTLVRAKETAVELCNSLGWVVPIIERDDLKPEDDPFTIARMIGKETKLIAIVGHNPFLEFLATVLIRGVPTPEAIVMDKASFLILEKKECAKLNRWSVVSQVTADNFIKEQI